VFAPGRGPRCVRRLDTRTWTPLPRISVRRFRGFTSGVPREILPGQWEAVEGASVSVDTKGQRKSKGDASSARRRAGKLPCGIERPRLRMQSTSPVPSYRQTLEWDHRRPGRTTGHCLLATDRGVLQRTTDCRSRFPKRLGTSPCRASGSPSATHGDSAPCRSSGFSLLSRGLRGLRGIKP